MIVKIPQDLPQNGSLEPAAGGLCHPSTGDLLRRRPWQWQSHDWGMVGLIMFSLHFIYPLVFDIAIGDGHRNHRDS